tara:strand:- start:127 stop:549 length:423 start_codon:yes stop_codon:yes gene_type:complete
MNTLLLILIGVPAIEIFVMIKIGQNIGALATVGLIFFTAALGIFFARVEGLNTLRSGVYNLYKNKVPIYEIFSGASIALAAFLLIFPGFITDTFGFLLLIPITRKIIINYFIVKKNMQTKKNNEFIEGEIVEKDKDKNEL